MKLNLKSAALVLALAPGFAFAATSNWKIDSAHSSADFSVKHLVISDVTGNFGKVEGTVTLDEKNLAKSSIDATIDASTIDTREPKRDAHLKSPDFFDVAQYPTITFKSTKVAKAGADKFKVTGDLTMHGVTKPVVLDVTSSSQTIKDPYGNTKRGAKATTVVNRRDFGLKWDNRMQDGNAVVGDKVTVTLNLELAQVAPEAAAAQPAAAPKAETKPAATPAPAPAK
jgi:polyisoprenoid-binding protein YceI